MNLHSNLLNSLMLVSAFALGCDTKSEATRQQLIGNWILQEGTRNGKITPLLEGTTFNFSENGQMSTNLPLGIESPAPFEVKENKLFQIGRHTIEYQIQSVSDSNLVLQLTHRGVDFTFSLKKHEIPTDTLSAETEL